MEAVRVTTFEPCGFRAKRTGAMTPNLDSGRAYGPRNARGRKFTDEQWAAWVAENYEVVYRQIVVGPDSENCEACSRTGNGLACEDHFYC